MCLGLLPFQTRVQKQYICPYCSALSSGVLSLHEDAYSEVRASVFCAVVEGLSVVEECCLEWANCVEVVHVQE